MRHTILLTEQTTGYLRADIAPEVGDTVTIRASGENGVPVDVTGIVEEVLDSDETA